MCIIALYRSTPMKLKAIITDTISWAYFFVLLQGLAGSNVKKAAVFFCASWYEPSMQMAEAWGELSILHRGKDIVFLTVEAETAPNACER